MDAKVVKVDPDANFFNTADVPSAYESDDSE